eukprot:Lankesteria_metandrocarpae@DN3438_c0_g2_i1.p1
MRYYIVNCLLLTIISLNTYDGQVMHLTGKGSRSAELLKQLASRLSVRWANHELFDLSSSTLGATKYRRPALTDDVFQAVVSDLRKSYLNDDLKEFLKANQVIYIDTSSKDSWQIVRLTTKPRQLRKMKSPSPIEIRGRKWLSKWVPSAAYSRPDISGANVTVLPGKDTLGADVITYRSDGSNRSHESDR